MKSTRDEAFLPPPIVYDIIEPRIWLQNLKPKKSVASQSLKAVLKIIYRMKSIRKPKKHGTLKYKNKSAAWKLINNLLPEMQYRKIEKKSRSKRSIGPNTKSYQESNPTRSQRQKRSDGNHQNLKYPNRFLPAGNSKYLPNLAMFYRHPELSVEEQHQQLNETMAESKKSRRAREDNRILKLKPHKPLYTPVFKECNDTTAASEIEDLNLPPPRPKYLKRKLPYIPGTDAPVVNNPLTPKPDLSKFNVSFPKILKIDDAFKDIKRPKIMGSIWESVKHVNPKNVTYVNLRDHQAEAKKSIQTDGRMKVLPDLAKAAIPRNATYVNLRDHQAEAKKSIQADGRMNKLPNLPISATPLYPKDIQPYNPDNIPYVEVPDYTDQREESLDEDDRRVAKERYTNIGAGGILMTDKSKNLDPDVPVPSEELPDPATTETLPLLRSVTDRSPSLQKGYTIGGDERSESVNKPLSKDSSNDDETTQELQLPEVEVEDIQMVEDEKDIDDEDESVKDEGSHRKDDDSKSVPDFQPVHFDINDYIKPFDYDKLFEDDKEKFSEELKDDSKELSGSERIESDVTKFPDHFTSRYKNLSPGETSTKSDGKISSEDSKEIPIIKPEEFYFGSKDFFQPISEEEREKSDRFASGSDFLTRYFNDDDDDELEKESVDKTEQDYESRDFSDPVKEEAYKTLSSSLEQKDYPPKFDTESKEMEKDDKVPPRKYHDFWRLEYTFPPQKINSGLQESMDERNKKNSSSQQ